MRLRWPYLWILLIGIVLYAPSAFFGLSYLDDNALILENRDFLNKLSNIPRAFGQDVFHMLNEYAAAYRPLLTVSFMIDARLDALFGSGYHLSNIVLHLMASCLVFLLFMKLRYARRLAFFFALLFTVHPALTQAVAWIPGRNDILLAIFVLSGFICLLDFIETGRRAFLAAHLVLFALALFTKEVAAVFPFVCVGYLFFVAKEKYFPAGQRRLIAGWSLAIVLWLAFRSYGLSSNPVALSVAGIAHDLFDGGRAVIIYLGKAVLPLNLSIVPTIKDTGMAYGIAALAAIVLGLSLSRQRRYASVLFGALWFLLFLAPTFIRPVPATPKIFLEPRLYVPLIGVLIVLGETDIVKNLTGTRRGLFAAAAVIGFFFVLSVAHERNFKDAATFWRYAAKRSPHSSMAQYNLGWICDRQGDLDKAERYYRLALELNPRQRYAHNALGTVYERKGLPGRAEEEYIKEIHNTPYSETAYRNLESLYRRRGMDEDAIRALVPQKP